MRRSAHERQVGTSVRLGLISIELGGGVAVPGVSNVGRGLSETALRILDRLGLAMAPSVERARQVGDAATLARALRYVADDYTREDAAKVLAEEGGIGAEIMLDALAEPNSRVRATSACGLRRVAWKDVDDTVRARAGVRLIAALVDPDPDVRSAAAAALGRVGGTGAVRALRAASTDSIEQVRLAVASALGRLLPNKIRQWEYEPPTLDWTPPRPMPKPMRSSEDPHPGGRPVERMPPIRRMKRALVPDDLFATATATEAELELEPTLLPRLEPEPSTAPPTLPPSRPPRLEMIDCPRCQKLSSPKFVRCHRCGARLRPWRVSVAGDEPLSPDAHHHPG